MRDGGQVGTQEWIMDAVDGGQQLNSKELSFGQLRKRGRKLKVFSVNHSFGMKEKQKHGAQTSCACIPFRRTHLSTYVQAQVVEGTPIRQVARSKPGPPNTIYRYSNGI
jgi:hypothetical protein